MRLGHARPLSLDNLCRPSYCGIPEKRLTGGSYKGEKGGWASIRSAEPSKQDGSALVLGASSHGEHSTDNNHRGVFVHAAIRRSLAPSVSAVAL
jgi:hypothetical protein